VVTTHFPDSSNCFERVSLALSTFICIIWLRFTADVSTSSPPAIVPIVPILPEAHSIPSFPFSQPFFRCCSSTHEPFSLLIPSSAPTKLFFCIRSPPPFRETSVGTGWARSPYYSAQLSFFLTLRRSSVLLGPKLGLVSFVFIFSGFGV